MTKILTHLKKWSYSEIEFLKKNYSKGIDYCSEKLNRSRQSIISKKIVLKLKNRPSDKWNIEEIIFLKNNYSSNGTDYCCAILERSKSSIRHKVKELSLKRIYDNWSKENLEKVISESTNYSEACKRIGLKGCGNRKTLKKYINIYKIDISHFKYSISHNFKRIKIPLNQVLIENSNYTHTNNVKKKLYEEGLKERKCEECGQGESWMGKKMSLILDHKNGINNDNRLRNLRILCPNCNATMETFCRGNKKNVNKKSNKNRCVCGNEKYKNANLCRECYDKKPKRKVARPDYETLLKQIKEANYCAVGRFYGVSDNAIRKWVEDYEKNVL